jgi:hypothetical protein
LVGVAAYFYPFPVMPCLLPLVLFFFLSPHVSVGVHAPADYSIWLKAKTGMTFRKLLAGVRFISGTEGIFQTR